MLPCTTASGGHLATGNQGNDGKGHSVAVDELPELVLTMTHQGAKAVLVDQLGQRPPADLGVEP